MILLCTAFVLINIYNAMFTFVAVMAESSHVNGNGAAAVDPAVEDTSTDCADIDSVCATIGKQTFNILASIDYFYILLKLYYISQLSYFKGN